MKCPDIDRLTDFVKRGAGRDPELDGHLQCCQRCQEETALIEQLFDLARNPVKEVPDALNQQALDRIQVARQAEEPSVLDQVPVRQLVAAGVLGFLTAFLAMATSGSAGSSGPAVVLGFPLILGSAAVVLRIRASHSPDFE